MSAYDELHRPGRLHAAAAAHAELDAASATLAQAGGQSETLVGKCARVALGRGCGVVVTEDWRESAAPRPRAADAPGAVKPGAAEVAGEVEQQPGAHEFACIRSEDLPSLDETARVSAAFSKLVS